MGTVTHMSADQRDRLERLVSEGDPEAVERLLTLRIRQGSIRARIELAQLRGVVVPGLVEIPAGTDVLGSPPDEEGRWNNEHQLEATFEKPYFMGAAPVTQAEYKAVVGKNPSHFAGEISSPRRPVECVSWYDAIRYCNTLSELCGLPPAYEGDDKNGYLWREGPGFRLPTEAEWEYAARAGSDGPRYEIEEKGKWREARLDEIAWYDRNSGGRTHAVRGQKPNRWGLHDCLGNVWEWCWDEYKERMVQAVPDIPFALAKPAEPEEFRLVTLKNREPGNHTAVEMNFDFERRTISTSTDPDEQSTSSPQEGPTGTMTSTTSSGSQSASSQAGGSRTRGSESAGGDRRPFEGDHSHNGIPATESPGAPQASQRSAARSESAGGDRPPFISTASAAPEGWLPSHTGTPGTREPPEPSGEASESAGAPDPFGQGCTPLEAGTDTPAQPIRPPSATGEDTSRSASTAPGTTPSDSGSAEGDDRPFVPGGSAGAARAAAPTSRSTRPASSPSGGVDRPPLSSELELSAGSESAGDLPVRGRIRITGADHRPFADRPESREPSTPASPTEDRCGEERARSGAVSESVGGEPPFVPSGDTTSKSSGPDGPRSACTSSGAAPGMGTTGLDAPVGPAAEEGDASAVIGIENPDEPRGSGSVGGRRRPFAVLEASAISAAERSASPNTPRGTETRAPAGDSGSSDPPWANRSDHREHDPADPTVCEASSTGGSASPTAPVVSPHEARDSALNSPSRDSESFVETDRPFAEAPVSRSGPPVEEAGSTPSSETEVRDSHALAVCGQGRTRTSDSGSAEGDRPPFGSSSGEAPSLTADIAFSSQETRTFTAEMALSDFELPSLSDEPPELPVLDYTGLLTLTRASNPDDVIRMKYWAGRRYPIRGGDYAALSTLQLRDFESATLVVEQTMGFRVCASLPRRQP